MKGFKRLFEMKNLQVKPDPTTDKHLKTEEFLECDHFFEAIVLHDSHVVLRAPIYKHPFVRKTLLKFICGKK